MKCFITGATGYIGFHVACALRRAGHEVWGLARTPEKGRLLSQQEIFPVIGTLQQPAAWQARAAECSVLIHAAQDLQTADSPLLDRQAVEALLATAMAGARPKTVIYTSGAWVYGNTGSKLVDETTALTPARLVARRPATEQLVLASNLVKGIVIRPGCVYGKQGGRPGTWFAGARKQKLQVIGDGRTRWAMVHVEDLADAYLRAAESGLAGEVFNVSDRSRATVLEMAGSAAKTAGYDGEVTVVPLAEALQTMGDFAECLALDQHIDSRKAVRLLGWQPAHGGFVDEVERYFESWCAAQPPAA